MKWSIDFCIPETADNKRLCFDIRSDAKLKTVYMRAVETVADWLRWNGILSRNDSVTYQYEMPNVWINGGVGGLWMHVNDEIVTLCIKHFNSDCYITI